jgi:hypothetical protein
VVAYGDPLGIGLTVVLRDDPMSAGLISQVPALRSQSPDVSSGRVEFANLYLWPWQKSRAVAAIDGAGFAVDRRRRWFVPFWRPVE